MKTLIISDTHLGKKLDIPKYNYLRSVIEQADTVIINGDFWDYAYTSFEEFLNSSWKELFPLLLEKGAVYLFGNHDREEWCDDRVSLFSIVQGSSHVLESGGIDFYLTHGHIYTLTEIFHKHISLRIEKIGWYCFDMAERFGSFLLKENIFIIMKGVNNTIKRKTRPLLQEHDFVVCGHTHRAEFDTPHRFINSGVNRYGIGQYLMIEDGEVSQYSVRY